MLLSQVLATAVIASLLGFMAASWYAYFVTPPLQTGDVLAPPQIMGCVGGSPNGACQVPYETCASCPADCCPTPVPTAPPDVGCNNNGICEPQRQESVYNCGDCPTFCGDGICAAHEVSSCCGEGKDCTVQITCGDGICSACESAGNCSRDCSGPTQPPTEPPTLPPTRPPYQPTREPVVTQETAEPTETPTPTPTATNTATPTNTPTPPDVRTQEPTVQPTVEPTAEPEPPQGPPPFLLPLGALVGAGVLGLLLFFFTRRRKEGEEEPGARDQE